MRQVARTARARLRPPTDSLVDLLVPSAHAVLLVAVEATHTSVERAVVAPLTHLDPPRTAVLAPVGWQAPAAYAGHTRRTVPLSEISLPSLRAVLAAGHYTPIGMAAFALAEQLRATFFISQHGALTPYAPPLPRAARLLAWSQLDGAFWTNGRQDVEVTVTGSQLLWHAGVVPVEEASSTNQRGEPPSAEKHKGPLTYLGQGHAAEISRTRLAHAALTTCREHGAVYRPHPSERDVTSRAVLAGYGRAGITVDTSGVPLIDLDAPVVSVFSTGVLEAAAQGQEAWVDFPRPPAWLGEFWERYGMHRLDSSPTPAPALPDQEPAVRIAAIVTGAAS